MLINNHIRTCRLNRFGVNYVPGYLCIVRGWDKLFGLRTFIFNRYGCLLITYYW